MSEPMRRLADTLRRSSIVRFLDHFAQLYPDSHMKDLVEDEVGPGREWSSAAIAWSTSARTASSASTRTPGSARPWGAGVRPGGPTTGPRGPSPASGPTPGRGPTGQWLGTQAVLIYPSVTLANLGRHPRPDGAERPPRRRRAGPQLGSGGCQDRLGQRREGRHLRHSDPAALDRASMMRAPSRASMVAIDGVFSMSGAVAPLAELNKVALSTAPSSTSTTPTAPASSAIGGAARCWRRWAVTTMPWWSARCPRPSPASAASSAARPRSRSCSK